MPQEFHVPPPIEPIPPRKSRPVAAATPVAPVQTDHDHHDEEVTHEPPSRDRWLRILIGGCLGVLLMWAMLVWGGPDPINAGLITMLVTLACLILAPVLTVVGIVQLIKRLLGKTTRQAGWLLPAILIAVTIYGYVAWVIWIGQTFWGWSVF